jgi:hypothetical protein
LNEHRNPEGQGENAASKGDPIGNTTSSRHPSVVTATTSLVAERSTISAPNRL